MVKKLFFIFFSPVIAVETCSPRRPLEGAAAAQSAMSAVGGSLARLKQKFIRFFSTGKDLRRGCRIRKNADPNGTGVFDASQPKRFSFNPLRPGR
ncbi:hypothetical protein [Allorhizobium borbori]|uniref:Uncharacterized protein n=1 Tax=Allorhizobium borbori TaxID=485907 RepID=A0A7W6P0H5_9HYPH|nr:hypothetical protein [Allorhizobium borbori]MBB4101724.1 hypothetical protein [Allorhizobium borbori]